MSAAAYCYLVELFASDGTSRRIYWAGRTNRVYVAPDGSLDIAVRPQLARRIPLNSPDLASDIAGILNGLRKPGNTDEWRATQHGFV